MFDEGKRRAEVLPMDVAPGTSTSTLTREQDKDRRLGCAMMLRVLEFCACCAPPGLTLDCHIITDRRTDACEPSLRNYLASLYGPFEGDELDTHSLANPLDQLYVWQPPSDSVSTEMALIVTAGVLFEEFHSTELSEEHLASISR
jgi:hypothetical protein